MFAVFVVVCLGLLHYKMVFVFVSFLLKCLSLHCDMVFYRRDLKYFTNLFRNCFHFTYDFYARAVTSMRMVRGETSGFSGTIALSCIIFKDI